MGVDFYIIVIVIRFFLQKILLLQRRADSRRAPIHWEASLQIESDKTTSIYNVSTRVLSKR